MSVDHGTVRRIAHLARIRLDEADVARMGDALNAILRFVEELDKVDVAGIEPMTAVMPLAMKQREDRVSDGGKVAAIVTVRPITAVRPPPMRSVSTPPSRIVAAEPAP